MHFVVLHCGLTRAFQLADLGNLTQPWAIDLKHVPSGAPLLLRGFKGATEGVPIPLGDLEREYCRLTNQPYPITEMIFVRSWMLFRVSSNSGSPNCLSSQAHVVCQLAVISQGIAARYARRQASSEQAFVQVKMFPVIGKLAKVVLEDEGIVVERKAKL